VYRPGRSRRLLAAQNLALKRHIAALASSPLAGALESGDTLGALALVDVAGASRPLEFAPDLGPTLLLVFTAECPACLETIPIWNEALASLRGDRPRVIGVQLDAPSRRAEVPGPFPVFAVDRAASAALDKIPGVPATVLVDTTGVVERVWFGVLDGEKRMELAHWIRASSSGTCARATRAGSKEAV